MASAPIRNPRKWRYTWETLAHIPVLRLYLFDSHTDPSVRCRSLESFVRFEESLLLVSWIEDDGDVLLRVPFPKVLIDHSCPIESIAKHDHIQIKLSLVLPVDHPLNADISGDAPDKLLPLNLCSDIENISSGNLDLFCKNCSTKLTRQPVSRFVEMPSVNWQEAADNWFGGCCCSFGGISEKLVSEYTNAYSCVEGTCLVDVASLIICKDDLEGYTFQQVSDGFSECSSKSHLVTSDGFTEFVKEVGGENSQEDTCEYSEVGAESASHLVNGPSECKDDHSPCALLSSADHGVESQEALCVSVEITNVDQNQSSDYQGASSMEFMNLDLSSCTGNIEKPYPYSSADAFPSAGECHCFVDKTQDMPNKNSMVLCSKKNSMPMEGQACLRNGSLGGGFLIKTSGLSADVEWVEFSCKECSSPVGSFPSLKDTKVPVDGGIRLFKCYVSTAVPTCGHNDIFRKHTIQRVFANLLHETAADELTFRTVVKDLRTKCPMLQILLLNSKAWSATGYCFENSTMEPLPETDMQPVVKVLFSDLNATAGANSGEIKDWSTRNDAEELHMLTHQIKELTESLNSAQRRFPSSCSYLQGMSLSYMER
ncbi:uncharacterized protein LOC120262289 [Dioscorea cayenensis subsp. rotundata]|uniref:Uncharacterized protein LOC120262289 n=1 Tax=Dioscorea cayennensis subsp. rotundata TaxID=55577 RepID=A0AB40BI97_DIOCR|nr:uncharacterized protein LOC120262289 [Dioscorea cayenensis subsp. rotundata]